MRFEVGDSDGVAGRSDELEMSSSSLLLLTGTAEDS